MYQITETVCVLAQRSCRWEAIWNSDWGTECGQDQAIVGNLSTTAHYDKPSLLMTCRLDRHPGPKFRVSSSGIVEVEVFSAGKGVLSRTFAQRLKMWWYGWSVLQALLMLNIQYPTSPRPCPSTPFSNCGTSRSMWQGRLLALADTQPIHHP